MHKSQKQNKIIWSTGKLKKTKEKRKNREHGHTSKVNIYC